MQTALTAQPGTAPVRRRRSGVRQEQASTLWAVIAWIVGLIVFFPVLYMFLTGFKTEAAAVDLPPKLIFLPTLENYRAVFATNFGPFFLNSAIASLVSTAIVMVLAVPAAYALALRPPEKAKDVLFFFISTRFLPPAGVIVPLYIIFKNVGLLGTMRGLIILYTAMNLPIAIWMLQSFLAEVPVEMLEAAQVDGAGLIRTLVSVVAPVVTPGLASAGLICFIFSWNELLLARVLTGVVSGTAPVFLTGFVTSQGLFLAQVCAASLVVSLPVLVAGFAAQDKLVQGLSMGAVK